MRVAQLDSHILDQELLALLSTHIDASLSLFDNTDKLSTILKTLLRATIWKLGIWDHGTTYGAQTQSLRYLNLTPPKKIILGIATVFGPLITEYLNKDISPRLRKLISNIELAIECMTLLNFIAFIRGSSYDSLLHRILGIKITSTSLYRSVSFEFLNRQLIWSQFTEFLLAFLPLLNLPRLRQKMRKYLPKTQSQNLAFLPRRRCAICYADGNEADIVNPYVADCGDVYCYICIVGQIKISEGEGWECLRCGKVVTSAQPFSEIGPTAVDQQVEVYDDDDNNEDEYDDDEENDDEDEEEELTSADED